MSSTHGEHGGVPSLESEAGRAPEAERGAWQEWMRELGQRLRRVRELVGLSQQEVARLAGVSQGAVSRLETARGLATPLLVVLKIGLALTEELRKLDQATENTELQRVLDVQDFLRGPERARRAEVGPRMPDRDFEDFVRLYHDTPARRRPGLLAIVSAAVAGLKEKSRSDA
jgi:transcriptional regulator with XRE-family HTH domain